MAFYSFENIDQAAQFAPKFNRIGPAIPKWRAVKLAYFKNAQKRLFFQKIVSLSNFDEKACFKVLRCSTRIELNDLIGEKFLIIRFIFLFEF